MKSNAQGVDGISLNMILLTLPRTLSIITTIINMSITSCTFPDQWKVSIIKPLHKVDHPTELNELRPISILPFMSKILEKVVCAQLIEYLNANNILPKRQSGFRTGLSTATALLDVVDDILAGQDADKGTMLVLLDFSRAFDTIDTDLLLAKLKYYGFNDSAVRWFSSYLSGRSQMVEVLSKSGIKKYSATSPVYRGVPQGSILGPILFILYTADLPSCVLNCNHHLYADDLQVYKSFKPVETNLAVNAINSDLDRIFQWSVKNGLLLNPVKTKLMVLGTETQIKQIKAHKPVLKVKSDAIEQVSEARNLGILFDSNLRFEKHVTDTVKQCFYRLSVLYQIRLENVTLDIEFMLGIKTSFYWRMCWVFITPVMMIIVFIYALVTSEALKFGADYYYPTAGYVSGYLMLIVGILFVPIFMGITIYKTKSIKKSFSAKSTWGPMDEATREEWRLFKSDAKTERQKMYTSRGRHVWNILTGGYRREWPPALSLTLYAITAFVAMWMSALTLFTLVSQTSLGWKKKGMKTDLCPRLRRYWIKSQIEANKT
ncbi:hypothetical protein evm_004061 [Chilo suppressalis]|nr:hypothetical protein evm_004061 [Chilo suppressalis]